MTTQLNIPRDLASYTWRPYRREDVPALYHMLLAVDQAEDRGMVLTLQDMATQFDDPWSNAETDSMAAFTAEGHIAAWARVFLNPQPLDECRAFLWGEVHPDHLRDGLEDFIFDWMEERGRVKLNEMPPHLPRVMRSSVQAGLQERITLLEEHAFRPVRSFYHMRRDLSQPIPGEYAPEGITLRTFSPESGASVRQALNESFADHWSFEPVSEEDWQMFFVDRSDLRPDLSFIAMDGDKVAGVCLNVVNQETNERQGTREGWIQELGVRRAWRKRGIASALLCASMRAFRANGLDTAMLGVDAENLTGALKLYERLGFVQVKRFIAFEKPVMD
jgi:mycothiol synthase